METESDRVQREEFERVALAQNMPKPTPDAWEDAKQAGSAHYKTGSVEPIDLYKAGGYFEHFAICNIIKYAFRIGKRRARDKVNDVNKIIHYATLLKASIEGRE